MENTNKPFQPTEVLAVLTGVYGNEAHVAKITTGYSVASKDAESEGLAYFVKIFKTEAAAMAYAKELVK
jgi:hypothetical protein